VYLWDPSKAVGIDISDDERASAFNKNDMSIIGPYRDQKMYENILSFSGKAKTINGFVSVGAAHVPGLFVRLRASGWSVILINHSNLDANSVRNSVQSGMAGKEFVEEVVLQRMFGTFWQGLESEVRGYYLAGQYNVFFQHVPRYENIFVQQSIKPWTQKSHISKDRFFSPFMKAYVRLINQILMRYHANIFDTGSNAPKFAAYQEFLKAAEQHDKRSYYYLKYLAAKESQNAADMVKWKELYIKELKRIFDSMF
jgi:hypothetical protein